MSKQHTQTPYVTGASVLAVKYKDGVMMVSDTWASYGSSIRYTEVERIKQVGDRTLVASSGEVSDFQKLCDMLDEKDTFDDWVFEDGETRSPSAYASWLSRVLYNRRCKMDPLWQQLLVGGVEEGGEKYLGYVDLMGTFHDKDDYLATGFGGYLAMPHLRSRASPSMSELEAQNLLTECMQILYHRHCRAGNKLQFAIATAEGTKLSAPQLIEGKWDHKMWVTPTSELQKMLGSSW